MLCLALSEINILYVYKMRNKYVYYGQLKSEFKQEKY